MKKLLAVLLALSMVLTCASAALADEPEEESSVTESTEAAAEETQTEEPAAETTTEAEPVEAAAQEPIVLGGTEAEPEETTTLPNESGYYKLTENITVSKAVALGSKTTASTADITLDLNGHSVTMAAGVRMYRLANGAKLKITNSAETKPTIYMGSTVEGGVVSIYDAAAELTVENVIISGKSAEGTQLVTNKAFVTGIKNAKMTFNNVDFNDIQTTNNSSTIYSGSVLNISGGAQAEFTDCTFNSCSVIDGTKTGSMGGAIVINGGASVLTLNSCTFTGCSAPASGGAIASQNGATLTATDCTFTSNTAGAAGGVIHSNRNGYKGVFAFTNCTFSKNKSTTTGGAINDQDGTVDVTNCTFAGNTSTEAGGAIYVNNNANAVVTAANCEFTGNKGLNGSAIRVGTAGTVNVDSCEFYSNVDTATNVYHGAFYPLGTTSTISGKTIFMHNYSSQSTKSVDGVFIQNSHNGDKDEYITIKDLDKDAYVPIDTYVSLAQAGTRIAKIEGTIANSKSIVYCKTNEFKPIQLTATEVQVAESFTAPEGCDTEAVAYTGAAALPTDGNYYLVGNVCVSASHVATADLAIDLNGYDIDFNGNTGRITAAENYTLKLTDSSASFDSNGRLADSGKICNMKNTYYCGVYSGTNGTSTIVLDSIQVCGNQVVKSGAGVAYQGAGALCVRNGSSATVKNCWFHDNEALYTQRDSKGNVTDTSPSAIYVMSSATTFDMENTVVSDNKSDFYGAMRISGTAQGNVVIKDCEFSDNTVLTGVGGALYTAGTGYSTFKGCLFKNNSAASNGGAIYVTNGGVTIEDYTKDSKVISTKFISNSAKNGGAIYLQSSNTSFVSVTNAGFENNTASSSGGAVYDDSTNTTASELNNCTFTGNEALYGSVIRVTNTSQLKLNGAELTGNVCTQAATGTALGAVYINKPGQLYMSGEIVIKDNTCPANGNDANLFVYRAGAGTTASPYVYASFIAENLEEGSEIYLYSPSSTVKLGTIDKSADEKYFHWTGGSSCINVYAKADETAGDTGLYVGHYHDGILYDTAYNYYKSLPAGVSSGQRNYYLTGDVTLTKSGTNPIAGNLNVCLNGYTVTVTHTTNKVIYGSVYRQQGQYDFTLSGGDGGKIVADATNYLTNTLFFANQDATSGSMTIRDVTISGVKGGSGALLNTNASSTIPVTLENVTITDCQGTDANGVIYHYGKGRLTLDGCTVANNTNLGNVAEGAGVVKAQGPLTISNSTFKDNTCSTNKCNGAAIFKNGYNGTNKNEFVVTNSTFINNEAAYAGGAIINQGSCNIDIYGCTFTGNKATYGGAIYLTSGQLTIGDATVDGKTVHTVFDGNSASGRGGAIFLQRATKTENKVTVNNTASVVAIDAENAIFKNNVSTNEGGAIYTDSVSTTQSKITGCTFEKNSSTASGGGAVCVGSQVITVPVITNSNFTDNTAVKAGGAIRFNANGIVNGGTFTGNSTGTSGGAIYVNPGKSLTLSNAVITGNTAVNRGGGVCVDSNEAGTSCAAVVLGGKNNITGNTAGAVANNLSGNTQPAPFITFAADFDTTSTIGIASTVSKFATVADGQEEAFISDQEIDICVTGGVAYLAGIGESASLNMDIGASFTMVFDGIMLAEGDSFDITYRGKTYDISDKEQVEVSGSKIYFKELDPTKTLEELTLTYHRGGTDDKTVTSSIIEYFNTLAGIVSDNETLALLKAVLAYGEVIRAAFGYESVNPVSDTACEAIKNATYEVAKPDANKGTNTNGETGGNYTYSATPVISMTDKIGFTICWDGTTEGLTYTLTVGEGEDATIKNGDVTADKQKVYTDTLSPLDYDKKCTIAIKNGENTLDEVYYSINAYLNKKWDSEEAIGTTTLGALVQAMAAYSQTAKAFVG